MDFRNNCKDNGIELALLSFNDCLGAVPGLVKKTLSKNSRTLEMVKEIYSKV